jgi:hypothetical protein
MKPKQIAELEFSVKNSGCYAAILQDDLLDLIATAKEVERLRESKQITDALCTQGATLLDEKRAEIERLMAERDVLLALLTVADCPECHGAGFTVEEFVDTVPECCGRPLSTGECCGEAVPAPELRQEQRQCQWCAYRAEAIAKVQK